MANSQILSVLIVDDNPAAVYLTCDLLHQTASNVVNICISQSALAAMGLLGSNDFDCIICNAQLSTMTGIEFARHVKTAGINASIIMLADSGATDVEQEAREAGVVAVLSKANLTSKKMGKAIQASQADAIPVSAPQVAARHSMAW